jgi:hypothetical protein
MSSVTNIMFLGYFNDDELNHIHASMKRIYQNKNYKEKALTEFAENFTWVMHGKVLIGTFNYLDEDVLFDITQTWKHFDDWLNLQIGIMDESDNFWRFYKLSEIECVTGEEDLTARIKQIWAKRNQRN